MGIVYRRAIIGMIPRLRRLRLLGAEAELEESRVELQDAVRDAARPSPMEEDPAARCARIEHLLRKAARIGFSYGRRTDLQQLFVDIAWRGDEPQVSLVSASAMEEQIAKALYAHRTDQSDSRGTTAWSSPLSGSN